MVNRIAEALIAHGAVEYGHFVLASGVTSPYYLDVKSSITDTGLLGLIGQEIAGKFKADVVAGVAVGGVPLAVAVALAAKKPYAIIRSAEKNHGKRDKIIGNVKEKDVILVEDVTTSGGSVLYGVKALRESGARVSIVVTVVDREQGATEALTREGITLYPLVKASELIRHS
ncbi:MAG TPA: orotate phosphoribosyltransferase [Methanoregulaceae archaeon]|nr:orotate phosphoribosyltransferase [Methanoregulaceae archaeon]